MSEDVFSTQEVAKICRVSRMTVNRWLKDGDLKGYKSTPKSNWKVIKKDLIIFMQSNNIPMDLLKTGEVKILIVDDEIDITSFISKALKKERNFEIDVANSGFKGGIKLTEFKPDIVILDIVLGDIDGREFFEHIRENPELNKTKVIGISGKIDPSEEQSLLEQGFSDFIRKPFKIKVLKETIYKVLEEAEVKKIKHEKAPPQIPDDSAHIVKGKKRVTPREYEVKKDIKEEVKEKEVAAPKKEEIKKIETLKEKEAKRERAKQQRTRAEHEVRGKPNKS